jgi:hypothetical protein
MPHGKIIIVLVAVFFVAAILRSLERSGTAIVDHPVVTFFSPFRLTTLTGAGCPLNPIIQTIFSAGCPLNPIIQAISSPGCSLNPIIQAVSGRSSVSLPFCRLRPPL